MDGCDIDDNGWRLIQRRTVKARKEHKCNNCDIPIKAGENYVREVATCEDGIYAIKYHVGQICHWYEA